MVPRPHAGGSWATTCWKNFQDPVAVEEIRAHAGIDIGGTLIGMHLKRVAVPDVYKRQDLLHPPLCRKLEAEAQRGQPHFAAAAEEALLYLSLIHI